MLETIGFYFSSVVAFYYLLFFLRLFFSAFSYLLKIDPSGSFNLLLNNQNNNNLIQSAGNFLGSSETIRQFSNFSKTRPSPFASSSIFGFTIKRQFSTLSIEKDKSFYPWLAGIIDGDGNFDIRKHVLTKKPVLKAIRIKLHNRDIRILTRIQNMLHFGRILSDKKKPYSLYIVSTKEDMLRLIQGINGLIRIKVSSFKTACSYLNIDFIESNYLIEPFDPYFSGLIDTDGSIVFNYPSNRIECNLEFKYNPFTSKLNFDSVIPYAKPSVLLRKKKNNSPGKVFKSIAFKFQTVNGMVPVYNYFMVCRLYSDFKFYRVSQIKNFIHIRSYAKYPLTSPEFQAYSSFVLN